MLEQRSLRVHDKFDSGLLDDLNSPGVAFILLSRRKDTSTWKTKELKMLKYVSGRISKVGGSATIQMPQNAVSWDKECLAKFILDLGLKRVKSATKADRAVDDRIVTNCDQLRWALHEERCKSSAGSRGANAVDDRKVALTMSLALHEACEDFSRYLRPSAASVAMPACAGRHERTRYAGGPGREATAP